MLQHLAPVFEVFATVTTFGSGLIMPLQMSLIRLTRTMTVKLLTADLANFDCLDMALVGPFSLGLKFAS